MKKLALLGVLALVFQHPAAVAEDNRNYPFRILVAGMVSGGVGLGLTFTSLFAGSNFAKNESTIEFKNQDWRNTFYAALALDGAGVLLFATAFVFACCHIGYTPIDYEPV